MTDPVKTPVDHDIAVRLRTRWQWQWTIPLVLLEAFNAVRAAVNGRWGLVVFYGVLTFVVVGIGAMVLNSRRRVLVLTRDRLQFDFATLTGWLPWNLLGPARIEGRGFRRRVVIPFTDPGQVGV